MNASLPLSAITPNTFSLLLIFLVHFTYTFTNYIFHLGHQGPQEEDARGRHQGHHGRAVRGTEHGYQYAEVSKTFVDTLLG